MQPRSLKILSWSLFGAATLFIACAGEENSNDLNGPVGGKGGTAGFTNSGGASSATGGASAGSAGKVGSGGAAGTSSGGSAGTSTAGTGGTTGGTGGTGTAGDCSVGGSGGAGYDDAIHVEASMGSVDASGQPGGTVLIYNSSAGVLDLADVTARYYFTSEFACDQAHTTYIDYAEFTDPYEVVTQSNVHVTFVTVGSNGDGCDAYLLISFDAAIGSLDASQAVKVQFRAAPPNYTVAGNQANDYSYGACSLSQVVWEKIPVYDGGVLVWGTEPDLGNGGAGGAGGAGVGGGGGVGGA